MQDQVLLNQNEEARKYELGYVLTSLDGEAAILSILNNQKVVIATKSVPEKFRLAYSIKKQTEGFFGFIKFLATPSSIYQVDKEVRFLNQVLRFMIIKGDPEAKAESVRAAEPKVEPQKEVDENRVTPVTPSEKKGALSNEELKAKLQEIS